MNMNGGGKKLNLFHQSFRGLFVPASMPLALTQICRYLLVFVKVQNVIFKESQQYVITFSY